VAAGLVAWLLNSVSVPLVVSAVASASLDSLLLAFGTVTLSVYLEAFRTKIIAQSQGIPVTTSKMLAIDLGASFFALFLPLGTLSRGAIRIVGLAKIGAGASAASVVIFRDRLESTSVMALLGLCAWVFASPSHSGLAGLLTAGAVVATVIVYLIVFTPMGFPGAVRWGWIPGVQRFAQLRESIGRARTMSARVQLELLAYSLVMHSLIVMTFYFLARSLDLDIPLVTMAWVRSAVTLITMLPVSIGGIGLRETAMLFFLSPSGVAEAQAVALAFLAFVFLVLVPGLAGGVLEAGSGLRKLRS